MTEQPKRRRLQMVMDVFVYATAFGQGTFGILEHSAYHLGVACVLFLGRQASDPRAGGKR